MGTSCNVAEFFSPQQLVFDITLCAPASLIVRARGADGHVWQAATGARRRERSRAGMLKCAQGGHGRELRAAVRERGADGDLLQRQRARFTRARTIHLTAHRSSAPARTIKTHISR
jgi:hypothetical protein